MLGSDLVLRIRQLPLHQKLLLAALQRLGSSLGEVPIAQVFDEYLSLCKDQSLDAVQSNLLDILTHLDCGGFLR